MESIKYFQNWQLSVELKLGKTKSRDKEYARRHFIPEDLLCNVVNAGDNCIKVAWDKIPWSLGQVVKGIMQPLPNLTHDNHQSSELI